MKTSLEKFASIAKAALSLFAFKSCTSYVYNARISIPGLRNMVDVQ